MPKFNDVSASVCSRTLEIVQGLEAFSHLEPWSTLNDEDRVNALPEVVGRACALALQRPADDDLCRSVLQSAASHGFTRRQQGLPESTVFEELAAVRTAIWTDLNARFAGEGTTTADVILRIDMAFTVASQASLRGYFRPEFEERGSWPQSLLELSSEWMPPDISADGASTRERQPPGIAPSRPWRAAGVRQRHV